MVTDRYDDQTCRLCSHHGVKWRVTDAFYRGGADFNKWAALEEGLDAMGRHGWLCLMDADVLWPRLLPDYMLRAGTLYAPLRHMAPLEVLDGGRRPPPGEELWRRYPIHPNVRGWAGYSQIFHADDPVLGPPPWHEIDWRHAGGADSFFQRKWPIDRKMRPPFNVLHLGPARVNWAGRSSRYLDGSEPPEAGQRRSRLVAYLRARQALGDYTHEKLPSPRPERRTAP